MSPNTLIYIPSSLAPGYATPVSLETATMEQAIAWMNAPASLIERIERKYILRRYITEAWNPNTHEAKQSGEGG